MVTGGLVLRSQKILIAILTGVGFFSYLTAPLIAASLLCPSGTRLSSNSWECTPAANSGRSNRNSVGSNNNQAAAAINSASAILSIASILGESLSPTDNLGSPASDQEGYGTRSRDMNRRGLVELQKGSYLSARLNFLSAAKNSVLAGNYQEEIRNYANAAIASALQLLRDGYAAEQRGNAAEASRHYRSAILEITDDRTGRAREGIDPTLLNQLKSYNSKLGQGRGVIENSKDCVRVNGEMLCD